MAASNAARMRVVMAGILDDNNDEEKKTEG
jgi:hypothetical protein